MKHFRRWVSSEDLFRKVPEHVGHFRSWDSACTSLKCLFMPRGWSSFKQTLHWTFPSPPDASQPKRRQRLFWSFIRHHSASLKTGRHCAFSSSDPSSTWRILQQLDTGDIVMLPGSCCEPAECVASRLWDALTCHKVHTFVSHLQKIDCSKHRLLLVDAMRHPQVIF